MHYKTNPAEREFVAHHFTESGQQVMLDLATGQRHHARAIDDPHDYADAQLVGPARRQHGASISTTTGERITSFFRGRLLPFGADDRTSVISIQLRDQYSLHPTEPLIRLSDWLHSRAIPHLVERSLQIRRWVIWIPLLHREYRDDVVSYMVSIQTEAHASGALDPAITSIPVLDPDQADHPHIPLHFFGAGFYSRLGWLSNRTYQHEDLSESPHLDLSTGGIYLVRFGEDPTAAAISHLVDRWWDQCGQRKVRAGRILQLVNGLPEPLPALATEPTSHSKAIALGRMLQKFDGCTIAGYNLHARASGNSTVYWLT